MFVLGMLPPFLAPPSGRPDGHQITFSTAFFVGCCSPQKTLFELSPCLWPACPGFLTSHICLSFLFVCLLTGRTKGIEAKDFMLTYRCCSMFPDINKVPFRVILF